MKFRTVIIIGLAIRLLIAPFFANPFDIFSFYVTGQNVLDGQRSLSEFLTPYQYSYFLFLFPMTIVYHFLATFIPTNTIHMSSINPELIPSVPPGITVVPGLLFDFVMKLPLIASDTIIALLLYRLSLRHFSKDKAVFASALWFLNPLTIWISSGWGMFDTLPALFTVVSLYFLLEKKFVSSGIAFVLAIAMKYYAIIVALPLALISWQFSKKREFAMATLVAMVIASLLFLPLINRVVHAVPSMIGPSASQGLSYSGLSIFNLVTLFVPNFDIGTLSLVLILASLFFTYFTIVTNRNQIRQSSSLVLASFALPIIFLLMFYQFVGANFLVWILPFLAILATTNKVRLFLLSILSLIGLASSFIDSLLPYNMLPMYPWLGKYLVQMVNSVSKYRVAPTGTITTGFSLGKAVLSGLGLASFVVLAVLAMGIIIEIRSKEHLTRLVN